MSWVSLPGFSTRNSLEKVLVSCVGDGEVGGRGLVKGLSRASLLLGTGGESAVLKRSARTKGSGPGSDSEGSEIAGLSKSHMLFKPSIGLGLAVHDFGRERSASVCPKGLTPNSARGLAVNGLDGERSASVRPK